MIAYILLSMVFMGSDNVSQTSMVLAGKNACDRARRVIVSEPGSTHNETTSTSSIAIKGDGGGSRTQRKVVYCFPQ